MNWLVTAEKATPKKIFHQLGPTYIKVLERNEVWLKPSRNLDTCQLWDYLYCFDLHLYNNYVLQAGDLQQIWIWGRACAETQGMKNYNCFDQKNRIPHFRL